MDKKTAIRILIFTGVVVVSVLAYCGFIFYEAHIAAANINL